ncbi:uncharacterized protein LOC120006832 [Tripterygium wilfordii]|uniref:uncharacterized protein LOC120006832 n=1 Tax=Tripterygium wilfordii TaxID=458696 RepID=UPI0018F804E1|nr:uncharacterized protein LOC120006832 [Tripterygium wilfordii]
MAFRVFSVAAKRASRHESSLMLYGSPRLPCNRTSSSNALLSSLTSPRISGGVRLIHYRSIRRECKAILENFRDQSQEIRWKVKEATTSTAKMKNFVKTRGLEKTIYGDHLEELSKECDKARCSLRGLWGILRHESFKYSIIRKKCFHECLHFGAKVMREIPAYVLLLSLFYTTGHLLKEAEAYMGAERYIVRKTPSEPI